jgi:alpha-tubulin suppressor-like RCC1 family protein
MDYPKKLSSVMKLLFLPVLALALGFGAVVLLLSQVGSARAEASTSIHAETQTSLLAWDAASFDLGSDHACAVTLSGGLKCWGANGDGQLGDNTTTDSDSPVDVSGLAGGVAAVSAGDYHTCALTSDGEARCWGDNEYGQLGDGTTTDRHSPVVVTSTFDLNPLSGVLAVSAGSYHTCALMTGGTAQCWGANWAGQLGDNTTTDSSTPVVVTDTVSHSPLSGIVAIAAGDSHTCALMTGGGVKCWGSNGYGQLGDNTNDDSSTPVDVFGLTDAASISTGDSHTCAVIGGGVKCWGYNDGGQLGDGGTTNSNVPVTVIVSGGSPLSGITAVAAGEYHTCALTSEGGVKCWGYNDNGQLGDGTREDSYTPVEVSGLIDAAAISVSSSSSCARLAAGRIKCWGDNGEGQLGNGVPSFRSTPVDVVGATDNVSAIDAGNNFTCAVIDGAAKCWGYNEHGKLGNDSTTDSATPVDVSGLGSGMTAITAGDGHACAVNSSGGLRCWGYDWRGELGDGNTDTESHVPVQVFGLTGGVAETGAGVMLSCARTTDSGAHCWGYNWYGQVGKGASGGDEPRPVTVTVSYEGSPLSGVSDIGVGGYHVCALVGGGVKCWGQNGYGQVGIGSKVDQSSPVDVVSLTSGVAAITGGETHACALMTDSTVKCWGSNEKGQLGSVAIMETCNPWGFPTPCSTIPVVVTDTVTHSPLTGVIAIAAGNQHTCAIISGGEVKCWGDNYSGQLGVSAVSDTCSFSPCSKTPVTVPGLADVAAITAGAFHTCARTTANGAKCWGDNYDGALGNGEVGYSTTPVWVVGFDLYRYFYPMVGVQ